MPDEEVELAPAAQAIAKGDAALTILRLLMIALRNRAVLPAEYFDLILQAARETHGAPEPEAHSLDRFVLREIDRFEHYLNL